MKKRYKNFNGRMKPVADIYEKNEHGITYKNISKDAAFIVSKLHSNGFEAYIVGGAVRDLLLGKVPKDFDITTSATPAQVHRIFRSSMIIGKRFRLCHVTLNNVIYEVSTFRSLSNEKKYRNNNFGTVDEDAFRRDFSINSLYYDPETQELLDFTGAMHDFACRKIRSIIPLSYTFKEDPVRMIRAIKYANTTGFSLKTNVKRAICRNRNYICNESVSRITEEVNKILNGSHTLEIFNDLYDFGILQLIMPVFALYLKRKSVQASLKELDEKKKSNRNFTGTLFYMVKDCLYIDKSLKKSAMIKEDLFRQIKVIISPITPPNYEIEKTIRKFRTSFQ